MVIAICICHKPEYLWEHIKYSKTKNAFFFSSKLYLTKIKISQIIAVI